MNDNDWRVREAAVIALGEIRDSHAVEPLLAVMKNDEWRVRKAAVVALGNIKDKGAVESLLMVMRDQDDWKMRKAAAIALGQIKDARAIEPLLQVMKEPVIGDYLAFGDTLKVERLKPLLNPPKLPIMVQQEVQRSVAQALAEIGGPLWLAALKDSDSNMSRFIAWNLGSVGDQRNSFTYR